MPIQILPAQLANQIAAGEVVERPASVLKELIENSLDAGATRIDVEVDKGGTKRLLVRDDGCGVADEELTLALSRHATSKVSHQDDLANIQTLGFRGEALASISSVSRLTLTSKPQGQDAAWQARASGRDMDVEVLPAAHPQGTSVEVCDLFYNTPARRKFLRAEKTEFFHIDELLKRLALSRFDVAIRLKHNDKSVRSYRVASTVEQQERRVAAVLGPTFIDHCVRIDNHHDQLHMHGWLGLGAAARNSNDGQYFYVNGRMMRDKLINHAIRQSLAELVSEALCPSYVLYLELPADQVDVNVHPSKHEVRFHQARLVHDYIVQVLTQVIAAQLSVDSAEVREENGSVSGPIQAPSHQYQPHQAKTAMPKPSGGSSAGEHGVYHPPALKPVSAASHLTSASSQKAALKANQDWLNSLGSVESTVDTSTPGRRPLHFVPPHYLLFTQDDELQLLDLDLSWKQLTEQDFIAQWPQGLTRVPLLLPLRMKLSEADSEFIRLNIELFRRIGFELAMQESGQYQWILSQVPTKLRRSDFSGLLPQLITQLEPLPEESLTNSQIVSSALVQASRGQQVYTWQMALTLFNQLEQLYAQSLPDNLARPVSNDALIKVFRS